MKFQIEYSNTIDYPDSDSWYTLVIRSFESEQDAKESAIKNAPSNAALVRLTALHDQWPGNDRNANPGIQQKMFRLTGENNE